ncbi:hypothetical protein [Polyangium fumosum]|uniref:Uncharacterized protein n=1 Tax=Polyangium fumosum TaxID=889272 RepID=A0A4U1IMF2_9BACT|nr:hypothetical protein [Polyangium fumosum]TKC95200.1 hypothetical protein E8A74_47380 [Polyangium fumosum]
MEPTACPAPVEDPCWRYRIQLVGELMNAALRAKYVAAFGDACYVSEASTFDCWYKTWEKACEDAALIGQVSGNAPYDKGYECQPDGVGNYWLQIGPDVANRTWIYFDKAPRQTPLVEVDGVPTEVSGPYRNLTEPKTLEPGQPFECDSGMVGADGTPLTQQKWILQVNRKAHGGEIHSDLAGFKWPCKNEKCEWVMCEEPLVLGDPAKKPLEYPDTEAQVHHVVPMNDKRSCSWGTNSNRNAAVISRALNRHFTNDNPPEEEVKKLNDASAYMP